MSRETWAALLTVLSARGWGKEQGFWKQQPLKVIWFGSITRRMKFWKGLEKPFFQESLKFITFIIMGLVWLRAKGNESICWESCSWLVKAARHPESTYYLSALLLPGGWKRSFVFEARGCIRFQGLLYHSTQTWWLETAEICYLSFGGWKSQIKVSMGLFPSGGSEGGSVSRLAPSVWWRSAPQVFLSLYMHRSSLCVSLFSFLYKDTSHIGLGTTLMTSP